MDGSKPLSYFSFFNIRKSRKKERERGGFVNIFLKVMNINSIWTKYPTKGTGEKKKELLVSEAQAFTAQSSHPNSYRR